MERKYGYLFPWVLWLTISLTLALLFYANYREGTWLAQHLGWLHGLTFELPPSVRLHFSSFIQVILLATALRILGSFTSRSAIILSCFATSIYECLQLTPLIAGTFDPVDVLAIIIGGVVCQVAFKLLPSMPEASLPDQARSNSDTLAIIAVFLTGYISSVGCSLDECDNNTKNCVTPVTLSWDAMRTDITPIYGNERALVRPGKVHVKAPYLFVIDTYRGLHVFDQTDPQNPIRLVYLPIIGITDISLNGDVAYVNNFTDLLSIPLENLFNGTLISSDISRLEHAFTSPPYTQFIPSPIQLEGEHDKYDDYLRTFSSGLDWPEKGIIIGFYDVHGEPILFGEYDPENPQNFTVSLRAGGGE